MQGAIRVWPSSACAVARSLRQTWRGGADPACIVREAATTRPRRAPRRSRSAPRRLPRDRRGADIRVAVPVEITKARAAAEAIARGVAIEARVRVGDRQGARDRAVEQDGRPRARAVGVRAVGRKPEIVVAISIHVSRPRHVVAELGVRAVPRDIGAYPRVAVLPVRLDPGTSLPEFSRAEPDAVDIPHDASKVPFFVWKLRTFSAQVFGVTRAAELLVRAEAVTAPAPVTSTA